MNYSSSAGRGFESNDPPLDSNHYAGVVCRMGGWPRKKTLSVAGLASDGEVLGLDIGIRSDLRFRLHRLQLRSMAVEVMATPGVNGDTGLE